MNKNIGPVSHKTAVYEWTKNFGRSMGQNAIRALSGMTPTITSTAMATRDTAQDIRMTIREFNLRDKKNSLVKSANEIFNEAMEDIRSGDFNVTRYADDLYSDFDSEFEDSFDLLDDEGEEKSQAQVTVDSSAAIAKSVISAGAAEIDSLNQMSRNISSTFVKANRAMSKELRGSLASSLTVVNKHLLGIGNRLDAINTNIAMLVEFNRTNVYETNHKMLEYMEKTSSMINEMGKLLAATTDAVEGRSGNRRARGVSDVISGGYFDMDAYKELVKSNFGSSTLGAAASMGGMVSTMLSGGGEKMNPLSMAMTGIMQAAVPKIIKTSITSLDKHFGLYLQHALEDLKDSSYTSDSMIKGFLGEIFGIDRYKSRSINMGNYEKGAMMWNGIAQKTLVEVIPELLTSIDSTLSKTEKRYMDYETGQFKTKSQIEKAYRDELAMGARYGSSDLSDALEKYMKDQALTSDQQREMLDKLNTLMSSRYNGDASYGEDYKKSLIGALGDFNDRQFRDITMLIEETLREAENSRDDMYKKISTSQSVYRNLNNTYKSEIYRAEKDVTTDFFSSIRPGSASDPATKVIIQYLTGAMSHTLTDQEIRKLALSPEVQYAYKEALTEDYSQEELMRIVVDAARQNSGGILEKKAKEFIDEKLGFFKRIKQSHDNAGGRVAGQVDRLDDFAFRHVMGINRNPLTSPAPEGDTGADIAPSGNPAPPRNKGGGQIAASTNDSKHKGLNAGSSVERETGNKKPPKKNKIDIGEALIYGNNKIDDVFKKSSNAKNGEIAIRDAIKEESELEIPENDVVGAVNASARATRLAMLQNTSFMKTMSSKIFGEDGILKNIWNSTWRNEQFDKLKEKLFNEKDGVFKGFKKGVSSFFGETKEALLGAYDFTRDNTMKYIYGEDYKNNENYKKYLQWTDVKGRKDRTTTKESEDSKVSSNVEDAVKPTRTSSKKASVEYNYDTIPLLGTIAMGGPQEKQSSRMTEIAIPQLDGTTKKIDSSDTQAIGTEVLQLQVDASAEAAEKIKSNGTELSLALFGDPEESQEKKETSFFSKFKKVLPKATAGAIIGAGASLLTGGKLGLIGGLFLPGGPLSAAIVGFGVTMLSQTEAFKSLLFGKMDEKSGERYGGLISKDLQNSFKKALPTMVGGAVLGTLKGMIFKPRGPLGLVLNTLLPGGPIGGALLGLGVSMIKHSDSFQNILFGKKDADGKRSGTWLSKSWNSMRGKMGQIIPTLKKAGAGLGVGALTGLVLSNMGVIPAAMSLGGPIGMGLAGLGVGIASASKKFNTFLFGSEEFDENGNPTGKHNKDGFLTRVKNIFTTNVFNPIATKLSEEVTDFALWTKQKIAMPFKMIFGPIIDSVKGIKEDVVDFVKDRFSDVTDGIKKMLSTTLKAVFSPITKVFSKIGRSLISATSFAAKMTMMPLTGLLKLGEIGTAKLRAGPKADYFKAYYGNMGTYLKGKWDAADESGKKRGILGKGHDIIDTLLQTNDEYRHMAKDKFAEGMDAADLNSLDWFREDGRDIRNERKANRRQAKGYDKINKLGQEVSKEFGGREVNYTDEQLASYNNRLRKIFKSMGLSEELLPQDSDSFNDLIYHRKKWKKEHLDGEGGSADTGSKIEMQESAEMIKARESTLAYQASMENLMRDLHDKFINAGMSSAEKTKKKRTELQRQREQNRIYKRMQKQGLNPDDYGIKYTASADEVSSEEWADYESSEEYNSGDFQGWYSRTHNVNRGPTNKKTSSFETYGSETKYKTSMGGFTQKDLDDYTASPEFKTRDFEGWYNRVHGETAEKKSSKIEDAIERIAESSEASAQATITSARLQTGGEIDTQDITRGKITNNLAAKFSNNAKATGSFISKGIGSIFNRFRKDKKKEESEAERNAREAEESKQASALGDAEKEATQEEKSNDEDKDHREEAQTKNKKSIWAKLLGIPGSILGFGGKLIGNIFGGITSGGLLSKLLVGAFGVATIDKLFPELFGNIGNFMEEKAIPWIENELPNVLGNFTNFVIKHGGTVIENTTKVITSLMPSLVKGIVATVKAGVSAIFGMVGDILHIGNKPKSIIASTEEEARDLIDQGYRLRENADGTWTAAEDYTIYDKNGNLVAVNDASKIDSAGRAGTRIIASLLRGGSDAGVKVLGGLGKGLGMLGGASLGIPGAVIGGKVGGGIGQGIGKGIQKLGSLIPDGSFLGRLLGRTAEATAEASARAGANAVSSVVRNTSGDALSNVLASRVLASNSADVIGNVATRAVGSNISETAIARGISNGITSGLGDLGNGAIRTITNNAGDMLETVGSAGLRYTDDIAGAVGRAALGTTDNVAGSVGKAIINSGDNILDAAASANKGFIQKVMEKAMKAFDSLANNKTFKKFFEKAADTIANSKMAQNGVIKTLKELCSKVFKKVLGDEGLITKWGSKLLGRTGASVLKVSPLGLIFTAYDVVNGALNAENLFGVQKADLKMRLVSSLLNTLLGIALVGPVIDIILEIASSLSGVEIKRTIATALYNAISSDEEQEKFANSQAALAVEADIYNQLNDTSLSTEAYNDLKNAPWYSKLWNNIKGLWGDNQNVDFSGQVTDEMIAQKRAEMEYGSGTISALAEASEFSAMQYEPEYDFANIGFGKGKKRKVGLAKAIGYGAGNNAAVYSQKNAKWARYKLGQYPDGQIATMADAGCGPTAMSMVASSITKKKVSPLAMGALAKSQGFISDGGANVGLFTVGAANMGLNPAPLNDRDSLATGIASGNPVILAGRSNSGGANTPFTKAGHIVVANGTDSAGNINIADPSDGRQKKYKFSDIAKQVNHSWVYGVKLNKSNRNYTPKASTKAVGYGSWNDPIDPNNPYINNFDKLLDDADDLKANSLEYLKDESKHSKKIQDVIDALYYFGSGADPKHSSRTDLGYAQGYLTDLVNLYDTSEGVSKAREDQEWVLETAKPWYSSDLKNIVDLDNIGKLTQYDLDIIKTTNGALYSAITGMTSKPKNSLDYSMNYLDAYNLLNKTGTPTLFSIATKGATGSLGITSSAMREQVRQNGLLDLAQKYIDDIKAGKSINSSYDTQIRNALSNIPIMSTNYLKAQNLLAGITSATTEGAFLRTLNGTDKQNYADMMKRVMSSSWTTIDGVVTHNGMPVYSMDDPKWSGLTYNGKSVSDNKQAAAEVFTLASLLSAYTGRAITPDFLIGATYPKAKLMKRDKHSGNAIWDEHGIRWSDILNPDYGLLSLPEFYGPDGKPLENIIYKNSSMMSNITNALKSGIQPLMMKGYQFEGSTFGTNRKEGDNATNADVRALNINNLLKNSLMANYMLEDGRIDVSDPAMALEQLQAAASAGIFRPNSLATLLGDTTQRNVPSSLVYPVIGIKSDRDRGVIPPLNATTVGVDDMGVALDQDTSASGIFGKFFNKLAAILNQAISSIVTGEAPQRVLDDKGNLLDQGTVNYQHSGYSDGTIETTGLSNTLASVINNPKNAKDELMGKAIGFTLLRESSGDYTAINPDDANSGMPSVGLIQFHQSAPQIFKGIADRTTGATRAEALKWANRVKKAFSGKQDPEYIALRQWMASPAVASHNMAVQDQMIIDRFTDVNIPPAAKQYHAGVLKNPKSIIPLADIANANHSLVNTFFKGYHGGEKSKYPGKYYAPYQKSSTPATEPVHVINEMRRFGFWNGENNKHDYLSRFKYMEDYIKNVTLTNGGPKPTDYNAAGYGPAIGFGVGGSIDNPLADKAEKINTGYDINNPFSDDKSTLASLLTANQEIDDFMGKVGNVFTAVTHTITNGKDYATNKAAIDAGMDPSLFGDEIDSMLFGGASSSPSYVKTPKGASSRSDSAGNTVGLTSGPASDWFKSYLGARVSSWYGPRVLNGISGRHWGIDFAVNEGTPIPSPVNGTVLAAKYAPGGLGYDTDGYGNYVLVKDPSGHRHYFAHLLQNSPLPVRVNDHIAKNQIVGLVGTTGNSTGDHLHYEIRKPGSGNQQSSAIDPNTYDFNTATDAYYGTAKKQMDMIAGLAYRGRGAEPFNLSAQAIAEARRTPIIHDARAVGYGVGGGTDTADAIRKLDVAVKTGSIEVKMDTMINIMKSQLETSAQIANNSQTNLNLNNTTQVVNAGGSSVKKSVKNHNQSTSLKSYHDAVARRPS